MAKSQVQESIFSSLMNQEVKKSDPAAKPETKSKEQAPKTEQVEQNEHTDQSKTGTIASLFGDAVDREYSQRVVGWITKKQEKAFQEKCKKLHLSKSKVIRILIQGFIDS